MHRRRFVSGGALAAAAAFLAACATGRGTGGNRYYAGPPSDHFDGTTFFNPGGDPPGNFGRFLRWRLGGSRTPWPDSYPSDHAPTTPAERLPPEALRVTMVGHATLLIQTGGLNILTDPIWSERASPVTFAGPRRVNPPGIPFDQLPPIDLVLLTHNHYDHLDLATLAMLQAAHDPQVITALGNDTIVKGEVPAMRVQAHDWGDVVEHQSANGSVRLHLEPCHHWSARGFGDRRMALWTAFVIESPAGKTYHVGDTGYHSGINYSAAAAKHGGFRLAILPVGAYEPRWFMKAQHQNPEEAARGFTECGAAFACGHHWGTFQLTDEGIEEPLKALEAALADQAIPATRFRPLRPGESWDVPERT